MVDPDPPAAAAPPPGARDPSGNGTYDPMRDLRAAQRHLAEAAAYAQQYVAAKVNGVLYGVRKLILLAVLGVVAGIIGATMLITASALLVIGLALALAALLPTGWGWWAGPLIIGLLGVLLALGGTYLVMRRIMAISRKAAVDRYLSDLRKQRRRYGNDAFTRSVGHAAEKDLEARGAPTRTPDQRQDFREKRQEADEAQRQVQEDLARLKGS